MMEEQKSSEETLKESLVLVKSAIKKEKKKLKKQEEELLEAGNYEQLSQWADTILAKRSEVTRGLKSLITENIHTAELEEIKLNPKCNADKNAELLYKKARKGRRGFEICQEKVDASTGTITVLQEMIDTIQTLFADGIEQQESVALTLIDEVKSTVRRVESGKKVVKKSGPSHPFRHYHYNGYDIYAGRTSTQNDELSIKFSKPTDIWFHAVGFAGSHVIIRRPRNAPWPPAEIIDIAGGIAVFFSKAKHTSYAEVHITEARFVRKPRHSPAGMVTAERCKSKRVSPVDPQKLFK